MSLYASYIKERLNKEIIETDKGFVTYYFINDGCYIEELYVLPEFRRSKEAFKFGDMVTEIAKQKNCNKLYGSVVPSTSGSTDTLMGLLKYGFKLDSTAINFIVVVKEI